MAEQTTRYVMLFRGKDADAAREAVGKVDAMPGVKVIRNSGNKVLLVEVATDDVDFPRRASDGGRWTVSVQRIYQLC